MPSQGYSSNKSLAAGHSASMVKAESGTRKRLFNCHAAGETHLCRLKKLNPTPIMDNSAPQHGHSAWNPCFFSALTMACSTDFLISAGLYSSLETWSIIIVRFLVFCELERKPLILIHWLLMSSHFLMTEREFRTKQ